MSDLIILDVGGTLFKTTKSTLCSVDGYFSCMLENGMWKEAQQETPIFIDRDPIVFRGVLSYLRSRSIVFSSTKDDLTYLQLLAIEADFYQLPELVKATQDEIELRRAAERRKLLDEYGQPMYKAISESEANLYFDRGWTFVSQYLGNETLGCQASGTNTTALWMHGQCTGCREIMSIERFQKHSTKFHPCIVVVTKKASAKSVHFDASSELYGTDRSGDSGILEFDQSFG